MIKKMKERKNKSRFFSFFICDVIFYLTTEKKEKLVEYLNKFL